MYHHILLVTKVTIGYHAYQSNSISKDIDVIHTNVISFLYVDYNPSLHPPPTKNRLLAYQVLVYIDFSVLILFCSNFSKKPLVTCVHQQIRLVTKVTVGYQAYHLNSIRKGVDVIYKMS